jgi:hypothetical protein
VREPTRCSAATSLRRQRHKAVCHFVMTTRHVGAQRSCRSLTLGITVIPFCTEQQQASIARSSRSIGLCTYLEPRHVQVSVITKAATLLKLRWSACPTDRASRSVSDPLHILPSVVTLMHVGGRPQRGWAGSVRTGSGRRLVTARAPNERSGHAYWRHHCDRKMSQAVGCHPKEYSKRLACVPDLSVACIMRIACNARSLHSGSFGQGNYRADGNSHVRQTYRYAVRDVIVGSNLQVLGATRQACV